MRPTISTKTGDAGITGLFGGKRVSKHDDRLHAYGTVDELNSILGVVLAEPTIPQDIRDDLETIQRVLFRVGADLATPMDATVKVERLSEHTITTLEQRAAIIEKALTPLTHFILPGGSRAGALLHQARTVCRAAERWVVALGAKETVNPQVIIYLNRLSDYFFLAARFVNAKLGAVEAEWRG